MEFYAFKLCLHFLLNYGLNVKKIVTDRHAAISKFLEENHPEISHRYDIWHVAKSRWTSYRALEFNFMLSFDALSLSNLFYLSVI